MKKISAYLIIRETSSRVENKNFLDLGGIPLYKWIIRALEEVEEIEEIIINTDCQERLDLVEFTKARVVSRSSSLCGKEVTANSLIESNISEFKNSNILMSHVTNPLLKAETIKRAIHSFYESDSDSLVSVDETYKRAYFNGQSINHDLSQLEQTQDIKPILTENSCIYIFSKNSFNKSKNRVGKAPLYFVTPALESFDLDEYNDWEIIQSYFYFMRKKI
jgi:CMP-N-acetylneuraminic acid synthetase